MRAASSCFLGQPHGPLRVWLGQVKSQLSLSLLLPLQASRAPPPAVAHPAVVPGSKPSGFSSQAQQGPRAGWPVPTPPAKPRMT